MGFSPFKITKVEHHSVDELLSRLKKVSMLKNPGVFPYAQAQLSLERMNISDIRPAQRYVLLSGLLKTQCLSHELKELGYDLMALDGYLTIYTDQSNEPIDLLPPIVELHREEDGRLNNIINDGMHRLYAARLEWRRPQVIYAQNLPQEYPYYAYPIPGPFPWEVVEILDNDDIPKGFLKKWHRIRDNKLLYRNFNSSFQNVGGPRGGGTA
jgi:hypothetical protein